ncbi:MAG: hypothetical protein MJY68_02940 [Bacteroidaceae bacterium]|nr:hypothetical protein [Bacteroidaceae bacterium]
MAQTEEINAVKFVQGQTIDWYLLADNPEVTFTDHNPVISGKTYNLTNGNVETEFGTAPAEKITLTAADFTVTKDGDWVYDKTEKGVNVELNPEYTMPPADKITIYYNNDKTVKPITPGTYQVYIDIEETDIYAAVTGITSEAWKFDITMPTFVEEGLKFEVTSHDPKTVKVIANDYKDLSFTIPATVSYSGNDYAVTAIGENAFAGVGSQSNPADLLLPADWKGVKPEATATLWYGGYFVDYRAATIAYIEAESDKAENSIAEAATDFVEIEDVKQAKADATYAFEDTRAAAKNTINEAADMNAINNAKDDAIGAIRMATNAALAAIEAAIASFKEGTIAEIKNVATHNKNSILEYAVAHQVKETAINEIDKAVAEAEASINNADSEEQVNDAKNDALNKINQQLAYVQNYYNQLQAAIAEIKYAANDAKEEIDGLGVDESAKSDAKAQIDNIAHTAEQTINEATSKDAIDNVKVQAITDIHNVVKTTKDMWVTVRTDVTAGNWNTICLERDITAIDGATFWTVSGQDATSFILDAVTEPQAGQGYLIRFTKSDLKVKYGDQMEAEPVTASCGNPIQGTFVQINAAETNVLNGNYVVYNNQLCPVVSWVGLYAHRAYVVADLVPNNAPAPAPGRARAYMPKPDQTPTELESVDGSQRTIRNGKFLRNGQLIIVKDNKMYNVQGMKL